MREIEKYYLFSSQIELIKSRAFFNWAKFFKISSFIKIIFYSDGYINLRFSGVCINKSFRGLGSNFKLSDRTGVNQNFYFFNPSIEKILIFKF